MRLTVLDDPQGAGRKVMRAAIARGHSPAPGFKEADAVYVRTCTYGVWRGRALTLIADAHRAGKPSLPTYEQGLLYDDKAAQVPVLKPWLPRTEVITDPETAWAATDRFRYPFISKAAVGAASRNVRLVETPGQALAEVQQAFQGDGIPLDKGTARNPKPVQWQRGYLIWQEFVAGNDGDVRVVINGDFAYGLRRFNRADKPFASGSGKRDVIRHLGGDADPGGEHLRAFILADQISTTLGYRWACYDFVFDGGRTYVLEVSFSWVENAYDYCPLFKRGTNVPIGATAVDWADLAACELEKMVAT